MQLGVEVYRLPDAAMAKPQPWTPNPFEGRVRVDPGGVVTESAQMRFGAGAFRVDTDQPLGDLAILLLEPESPDSLFQWGSFLGILNRTEYAEGYVMEPMAQRMLADSPELAREFNEKLLNDADFASDTRTRLEWFYEKTPYYDQHYRVYPVVRVPK